MTKITLTESDIIQIVEKATKNTLRKILKEGIGFDSFRHGLSVGYGSDDMNDDTFNDDLKRYIKDGYGTADYDSFITNDDEYKKMADIAKEKDKHFKEIDSDKGSYPVYDHQMAKFDKANSKNDRINAAQRAVKTRPGVMGKIQRTGTAVGAKLGRLGKKIVNTGNDIKHNVIGLREE